MTPTTCHDCGAAPIDPDIHRCPTTVPYADAIASFVTQTRKVAELEAERAELAGRLSARAEAAEAALAELRATLHVMTAQRDHAQEDFAHAAYLLEREQAKVARVEALADEWDAEADANDDTYCREARVTRLCARDLRAALSEPDATGGDR